MFTYRLATFCLRFKISVIPSEALIKDDIVPVLVDYTVNIRSFHVISLPFTCGDSGGTSVSSLLVLFTSSFASFVYVSMFQ